MRPQRVGQLASDDCRTRGNLTRPAEITTRNEGHAERREIARRDRVVHGEHRLVRLLAAHREIDPAGEPPAGHIRDVLDARQSAELILQFFQESRVGIRRGGPRCGVDGRYEDVAGVESDVDAVLKRKRSAGEPGARQQENRKRKLQDDQPVRQPRASLDDSLFAHLEERQQLLMPRAERGSGGDRNRAEQRQAERVRRPPSSPA